MEKLKVPVVTDEDVLEVLRLWHFKSNRSRTNVFPDGANMKTPGVGKLLDARVAWPKSYGNRAMRGGG